MKRRLTSLAIRLALALGIALYWTFRLDLVMTGTIAVFCAVVILTWALTPRNHA